MSAGIRCTGEEGDVTLCSIHMCVHMCVCICTFLCGCLIERHSYCIIHMFSCIHQIPDISLGQIWILCVYIHCMYMLQCPDRAA